MGDVKWVVIAPTWRDRLRAALSILRAGQFGIGDEHLKTVTQFRQELQARDTAAQGGKP